MQTAEKKPIKNLHVRVTKHMADVIEECMFRRRHKSLQHTLMEALQRYVKWVEGETGEIKIQKPPAPAAVRTIGKRVVS